MGRALYICGIIIAAVLLLNGFLINTGGPDFLTGYSTSGATSIFTYNAEKASGDAFIEAGAFVLFLLLLGAVFGSGKR